jgi:hypothetical protein
MKKISFVIHRYGAITICKSIEDKLLYDKYRKDLEKKYGNRLPSGEFKITITKYFFVRTPDYKIEILASDMV